MIGRKTKSMKNPKKKSGSRKAVEPNNSTYYFILGNF